MTQRSDRIHLAADEPRCEPSKPIAPCHKCARKLAAIPPMGKLQDYSLSVPLFVAWCGAYRPCIKAEPAAAKKEVKPWPTA